MMASLPDCAVTIARAAEDASRETLNEAELELKLAEAAFLEAKAAVLRAEVELKEARDGRRVAEKEMDDFYHAQEKAE